MTQNRVVSRLLWGVDSIYGCTEICNVVVKPLKG